MYVSLRGGGGVSAALNSKHRKQDYAIHFKPTLGIRIRRNGIVNISNKKHEGQYCTHTHKLVEGGGGGYNSIKMGLRGMLFFLRQLFGSFYSSCSVHVI